MKEALAQLGIKNINEGTSTGLNHFQMEKLLFCRWSIDSKKNYTAADYEK
jgi:aldehyde dehydrogenase (NAD+)